MGGIVIYNYRRCKIEILGELLDLSKEAVNKTKILYNCNLSHSQLNRYLSDLLDNDFLEEMYIDDNGTSYKLYKSTDKGLMLLDDINKVLSYFKY